VCRQGLNQNEVYFIWYIFCGKELFILYNINDVIKLVTLTTCVCCDGHFLCLHVGPKVLSAVVFPFLDRIDHRGQGTLQAERRHPPPVSQLQSDCSELQCLQPSASANILPFLTRRVSSSEAQRLTISRPLPPSSINTTTTTQAGHLPSRHRTVEDPQRPRTEKISFISSNSSLEK
jgi:hypothetical protein